VVVEGAGLVPGGEEERKMRMNRRFDSVASLREGVALNSAGAVPEQVREPRIQLLVGHLPHANLRIERELVPVALGFILLARHFKVSTRSR
jgi:hypothetical protein